MYLMAVISVESQFKARAISHASAYGLMQMTRVAVTESIKYCNLRKISNMTELLDSATNVRYGSCYLKKVLDQADGDWDRALILYNGGSRQLTKYMAGSTIASETANYVLQVRRALRICN